MGVPRSNAATKERAPKKRSPLGNRRRGRYEKEEKKQRKAAPCGRAKEREGKGKRYGAMPETVRLRREDVGLLSL